MCVLAGVVLSIGTITIDRLTGFDLIPRWMTGGPDAALGILTTIAVSMVSLATLVLTITMVVVQLAMGQFSPRIVQTFLRDKPSQLAIGLFVATFAHAMLSIREVQFEDEGQVPGIAIGVAYVLVLVSIAMLVLYVDHIGRSLRVSSLIELVGDDTRRLLDDQYPEMLSDSEALTIGHRCGHVRRRHVDRPGRVGRCGRVGRLRPARGARRRQLRACRSATDDIEGQVDRLDRDAAAHCVELGLERTLDEDVGYGFRMLVDVAERSLSESPFLDPTTAVQSIDRLHDGLRQLSVRVIPDGRHYDDAGHLRLTVPTMDWDAYVHLAFDEIRLAGAASPQVSRRLIAALTDLIDYAPSDRRPALVEQLELLEGSDLRAPARWTGSPPICSR